MPWDMNALEEAAYKALLAKEFEAARQIYLVMGDGDPSLDGGHLGDVIGDCYEGEHRRMEAKFWYNRAFEENPGIDQYHPKKNEYAPYLPNSVRGLTTPEARELAAAAALRAQDYVRAREIYLVLADGNERLNGGHIGYQIGLCYEAEGRTMEAKFWFNRAFQENRDNASYRAKANAYRTFYPDSVRAILGDTLKIPDAF